MERAATAAARTADRSSFSIGGMRSAGSSAGREVFFPPLRRRLAPPAAAVAARSRGSGSASGHWRLCWPLEGLKQNDSRTTSPSYRRESLSVVGPDVSQPLRRRRVRESGRGRGFGPIGRIISGPPFTPSLGGYGFIETALAPRADGILARTVPDHGPENCKGRVNRIDRP